MRRSEQCWVRPLPIFGADFTLRTEQNYSSGMGQSGRKLMLALVAFGAGGFVGLVAAAADETSSVSPLRRSAAAISEHAPAEELNALPLLPAPEPARHAAPARVEEPPEPTGAPESGAALVASLEPAGRPDLRSAGAPIALRRQAPRKKSPTWARSSEIIDPWSSHR